LRVSGACANSGAALAYGRPARDNRCSKARHITVGQRVAVAHGGWSDAHG
jgi:hypothetical protein